jgi:hypothetical protein
LNAQGLLRIADVGDLLLLWVAIDVRLCNHADARFVEADTIARL